MNYRDIFRCSNWYLCITDSDVCHMESNWDYRSR
jgi:hypothetical protein